MNTPSPIAAEANTSSTRDFTVYDNIPEELKQRRQWVCFNSEKAPCSPATGHRIDATKPENWSSVEDAADACKRNSELAGIGYALSEGDPYVAIDLDKCRDKDSGVLEPWAQEIVDSLSSYTEVSPSGTGVHIFIRGDIPEQYLSGSGSGRKLDKTEVYQHDRYLTVTGDYKDGTPREIEERQEKLDAFMEKHFSAAKNDIDVDLGTGPIVAEEVDAAFFDQPQVKSWWEKQCTDLSDQSASNYDARLAHLVGDAGMGMGHFKRLVQIWREKHDENPEKAERDDYIRRTWAMTGRDADGALQNVELPEPINPQLKEHRELVEQYRMQRLEAFGTRHGLVNVEGQARLAYKTYKPGGSAEDGEVRHGYHTPVFSPKDSANMLFANQKVPSIYQTPAKVGTDSWSLKWETIFEAWLDWEERKTFDRVEMIVKPGVVDTTPDIPEPRDTGGVFNLFQGTAFPPKKGDCKLIKQHILHVWCNGRKDVARYVYGWLGCLYAYPQKLLPALVLRSGEGAGKGIVIDGLQDSWGGHQFVASKSDDITSDFNEFIGTSVFVYLNEAVWGGEKKHQGTLKSLITDKKQTMNRKYLPRVSVDNHCHLIISTNEKWVVPVGIDDRRFVFLDVTEDKVGDREYFKALKKEINDGGIAALMYDVMQEENLKGFDPWKIPTGISAAKAENKLMSAEPRVKWLHEALECGVFKRPDSSNCVGWVSFEGEWPDDELKFFSEHKQFLLENYTVRYNKPAKASNTLTQIQLIGFLKQTVGATVAESKGPDRPGYWVIPPLAKARTNFNKFMGEDMEFED